jgi:5-methyltetrahydrofolate corrinoid/iron sulfur protein methyltransferase
MLIIGENIHIIAPKVKEAIENREAKFLQDLARRQVRNGAHVVDLNIGPQKKQGVAVMEWLVEAIQEAVDVPLSLDTTNAAAIEAGLKRCQKQAWINSTSADPARMEVLFPLAAQYNAKIIALTMEKGGIPPNADGRVQIAMEMLIPKAMEYGVPMENLYLDPLTLTVNGMQDQVAATLEGVRMFKQLADPPPQTVVGLSNVSNSCPDTGRSLINRTFLVMLLGAGLDSAIADPLDKKQNEVIRIVEKRDTSTGLGRLLVALHDATQNMEDLDPGIVDMNDPEQVKVWKTYQVLKNQIIYAHSYLRI